MKNIDILNCLEEWCPSNTAASYDNVGFLVGDQNQEITKILVALDCTSRVIEEAKNNGLVQLKGHRSVGGMRASIYNAMPIEGVEKLVEFMAKFEKENA